MEGAAYAADDDPAEDERRLEIAAVVGLDQA